MEKKDKKTEKQKIISKEDGKDIKIKELTDCSQRLQAEFENYKRYVEKSNKDYVKFAKSDIIEKLLSVLDAFELAFKSTDNKEEFVKGIELIYSQVYSILEKEGLRKIKAEGKFDPHFHEVLLKEPSDKEEDTILLELQKGYMLGEKVLRHSKVKVSEHVKQKDNSKRCA